MKNKVAHAISSLTVNELEDIMKTVSNVKLAPTVKGTNANSDIEFSAASIINDIRGDGTEENPGWSKTDIKKFIKESGKLLGLSWDNFDGLKRRAMQRELVKELTSRAEAGTAYKENKYLDEEGEELDVDYTAPSSVEANSKSSKINSAKVSYHTMPEKTQRSTLKDYLSRKESLLKSEIVEWGGKPKDILANKFKRKTPNKEEILHAYAAWLLECDIALFALDKMPSKQLEALAADYGIKSKKGLVDKLAVAGWRLPNHNNEEKKDMAKAKPATKAAVAAKPAKPAKQVKPAAKVAKAVKPVAKAVKATKAEVKPAAKATAKKVSTAKPAKAAVAKAAPKKAAKGKSAK